MKPQNSNEQKSEPSPREAWLLVHLVENYPDGADEVTLAASLNWPIEVVVDTLDACAAFGLMGGPAELSPLGVPDLGLVAGLPDLLTRDDVEAAKVVHGSADQIAEEADRRFEQTVVELEGHGLATTGGTSLGELTIDDDGLLGGLEDAGWLKRAVKPTEP